jgi:NAD(P)-dependent dehydrogenase (short-subunit alcohol dehydrogenase family)
MDLKQMRSLKSLMDLGGRRALVSGGAGHLGKACVESLLELGAKVAILDKDPAACERRATELGPNAWPLPCDMADEGMLRARVAQAIETMGGLDILIHCAAFVGTTQVKGWAEPFDRQTVEAWDSALRVNLTAGFIMAQESRRALEASGHGSIILFGSIYGMVGPDMQLYEGTAMANPVGYGVSKGGLLQLVRYLAALLAPRVRVNAISPGGVWRGQPEIFRQRYEERTPLKRMACEEDVKGAVAYLASDLGAYVSGQNLAVDGGWTVW